MIPIDESVQRAIDLGSNIYNKKSNCPDDRRDAELRFLYELAEMAPDGSALEAGVKRGGSLACWYGAREGRGTIYAVDDWSSKTEDAFLRNMEAYNIPVVVMSMNSWEAAGQIDEQMAFVFIDSDHALPVWNDVREWPPKMLPGGVLAFHDYGVWKPTVEVKRAVDDWQSRDPWECLGQEGSTIAFRKPG